MQMSYAYGYAISTGEHYYLIDELLKEADKRMYEKKKLIKSECTAETSRPTVLADYHTFVSIVEKELLTGQSDSRFAFVCSDINNLRCFNDQYGHEEGDHVLAQFIYELGRQPFCLCSYKLYSDKFAFLADISQYTNEQAIECIRDWNTYISGLLNQSYDGNGNFVVKSGLYFVSDPKEPVETMLNKADCARKSSKTSFSDIVLYSEELGQSIKLRSEIINSFQNAVRKQEFRIFVQPKILRTDKSICSAEVLVRWQRSDGVLLSPNRFVPVFEQTGDIVEMDFYVYEKVFRYLYEKWLAKGAVIPLSVNVSRIHLFMTDDFMERLKELHARYPIPLSLIVFELTESAYIQEIDSAGRFIDKLREMGYQVSMDDFGNGYF